MRTTRFLVAFMLIVAFLPLFAAQDATNTKGFVAEGVYDSNDVDSVNLFNGGLTVHVPLGQYMAGDRLKYAFSVVYNSAFWDYKERNQSVNNALTRRTEAVPNTRVSNAGLGWLLTLGELYYNGALTYVSPDGGEVNFTGKTPQSSSRPGPDASLEPVLYSLDSQYLRVRKGSAGTRYVDFPDGITKEFACTSEETDIGSCDTFKADVTKFALVKISDAFGNEVTIDRDPEPGHTAGAVWTWNVREKSEGGRAIEHHIKFQYLQSVPFDAPYGWVVKELELETSPTSFTANQPITEVHRVSYTFNYQIASVTRPPLHTANRESVKVQPQETTGDAHMHVPVLASIVLPDGSQWSFQYKNAGQTPYPTQVDYPQADDDKVLERITYPTGGSVHYEWQLYTFPRRACFTQNHPPGCIEPCTDAQQLPDITYKAGVKTRQLERPSGDVENPTRYIVTTFDAVTTNDGTTCFGDHTLRNTVVDPLGNVTLNYFSLVADPNTTIAGATPLNFGLPSAVTKPDPSGGSRNLSAEVFQCASPDLFDPSKPGNNDETIKARAADPASAGCSLHRQTYVRFEVTGTDCAETTYDVPGCYGANRRLLSQRTVFHDDGDSWILTENSDFDGLGHYRQADTTSNFGAQNAIANTAGPATGGLKGPRGDSRTSRTNWNPAGRFGSLGYPATFERWILNTYDSQSVEEKTTVAGEPAAQGGVVKSEYFFDSLGFLKQKRVLAGASRSSNDLLTAFNRVDLGDGRVRLEERYYGGDCVNGVCPNLDTGTLPVANPGSAGYVIFRTYRFGALEREEYRECSGDKTILRTQLYELDPATGLMMSSRDTAGAITTYLYDDLGRLKEIHPPGEAATSYTYNKASGTVPASVVSSANDGTTKPPQMKWEYDPWGRVASVLHRLPSGWNRTTTHYYATGWVKDESTAGQDGASNAGVTKFTKYDPFGRVLEKTHADSDSHTTSYSYQGTRVVKETVNGVALTSSDNGSVTTTQLYDAAGRLVAVTEESAGKQQTSYEYDSSGRLVRVKAGTQERSFVYDNRGFLLNENHPELGVSAGITYKEYDSRGHFHELYRQTPPTRTELDLTYVYDAAERLTIVKQPKLNRILKTWAYYQNSDTGRTGLLRKTERHNWVHNPASVQSAPIDYTITESYDYWDSTHRLKSTTLSSAAVARWKTTFFYDNLGNVSSVQYPKLTVACVPSATCWEAGPDRLVSNNYEYGYLTSLPGYINSVTYNYNELPKAVTHANNVVWTQSVSSRNLVRPSSLKLTLGTAQPLWESGDYQYDARGSIFGIGGSAFTYDAVARLTSSTIGGENQQFTYDRYGNHTGIRSDLVPDAATNRLPGSVASYDIAGNVVSFKHPQEPLYTYAYEYDPFGVMHHMTVTKTAPGGLLTGRIFLYNSDDERVASIDYQGSKIKETWSARGGGNLVVRDFQRVWDPAAALPGRKDPAARGWTFVRDYIYRSSALAATVTDDPATHTPVVAHLDVDHLGTPRLITDKNGLLTLRTYRAFGDEISGPPDPVRLKFTGHEHDDAGKDGEAEIQFGDLDYMHARYYNAKLARFLSLDPGRDVDASHPQSWNLYAYVRNSPIGTVDPTGRAGEPAFWHTDVEMDQRAQTQQAENEAQRLAQKRRELKEMAEEQRRADGLNGSLKPIHGDELSVELAKNRLDLMDEAETAMTFVYCITDGLGVGDADEKHLAQRYMDVIAHADWETKGARAWAGEYPRQVALVKESSGACGLGTLAGTLFTFWAFAGGPGFGGRPVAPPPGPPKLPYKPPRLERLGPPN